MRVLLVNSLYEPYVIGGAERVVQALAEQLVSRGHDVAVACLAPDRKAYTAHVGGVRVHYMPLRNVYPLGAPAERPRALKPLWHLVDCANPMMQRSLARVIDREKPQMVHTHNLTGFSTLAWTAALDAKLPVVHTLHDYYLLCMRSTMFAHGRNCARQELACAALSIPRVGASTRVSAVVGVSEFVLRRHLEHGAFAGVPARVIPNFSRFPVQPQRSTERRDEALRIAFVGRIEPAKGVEVLLREASAARGEWELRLAGTGDPEYVRRLRARFPDERIQFLGAVDAADVFAWADALVMPSISNEVSPLVIYEAYAFGVPVIGAARGGIPELVGPGLTGEVFDPDVDGALAAIVSRWAAAPEQLAPMRGACRARATALQPGIIAQLYEDLYSEILARVAEPAVA